MTENYENLRIISGSEIEPKEVDWLWYYLLHNIITKNCRAKWRILHLQNGENCRGYSDHQAMKNPLQT